jgi:hypothetical protein
MHSFTEEVYIKLRECLDNERRFLSQVSIFTNITHLLIFIFIINLLKLTEFTKFSFTLLIYNILRLLFIFRHSKIPNLYVNFHLMQHAKNYAILLNTGVGTKDIPQIML